MLTAASMASLTPENIVLFEEYELKLKTDALYQHVRGVHKEHGEVTDNTVASTWHLIANLLSFFYIVRIAENGSGPFSHNQQLELNNESFLT